MANNVVVIGAVALGPKAASRFKRLEPGAKVTMLDRSEIISYGGCGIPYFVGGEVSEAMQLRTTSFHMVRDEQFFDEVKGVDVVTPVEATSIDREKKQVHTRNLKSGETAVLDYDKLVIATGATPRKLNLPGENLENVHYVANVHDAERIRDAVTKGQVGKAVIVGGGFIGLEMAEAFADMWGIETTVVEVADQIMPRYVSPALSTMGRRQMEENGVKFFLGETVEALEGDGRVQRVKTTKRTLEADMVIISAGVIPNSDLAEAAGLEVSERGGIIVDEHMRTSDPDIYAGGDCVLIKNIITGNSMYLPMGSLANRQGRVIGTNLAGGDAKFEGALGSFVVKLFEKSLAGVGMSLETALMSGYDAMSVLLVQLDRAHFYPEKELMTLELVFDKKTRQVLGLQGFGSSGDAMVGRINAVAAILKCKPTLDDISNLEMAYSPPFSSAMDILNALGNVADNAVNGRSRGIGPEEFARLWEEREKGECFFLDCREVGNAESYLQQHPDHWHNIPQGEIRRRLEEIPKDRKIVLLCNTGARSYEAQITLDFDGREDVVNLQGGMAALMNLGKDIA